MTSPRQPVRIAPRASRPWARGRPRRGRRLIAQSYSAAVSALVWLSLRLYLSRSGRTWSVELDPEPFLSKPSGGAAPIRELSLTARAGTSGPVVRYTCVGNRSLSRIYTRGLVEEMRPPQGHLPTDEPRPPPFVHSPYRDSLGSEEVA